MREQRTTRLGSTIHAYAVTAAGRSAGIFHCFAPFAPLFVSAGLPIVAHPRSTRWYGEFDRPLHGEHVRDTMARSAGVQHLPILRLASDTEPQGGIVFCPHAAETFKEWPDSRWAALAEELAASGKRITVLPAPGRPLSKWPTGVLIKQVDIGGLARALASAEAMVGCDSGHVHLADALGTPAIGLYAATSAITYGPYSGARLCIDRHREAFPSGVRYDSSVHLGASAMMAISLDGVIETVRTALGEKKPASP